MIENDKTPRNFFPDYHSPLLPQGKNSVEISRIEKITERKNIKELLRKPRFSDFGCF
jgi:hypothetical protein